MLQIISKTLTLEEFLQQPETTTACEYIDGNIIPKPIPQGKHSTIQGEFVPAINRVLTPQRLGRAFPELRCTFGSRSTVPDIAVFVWSRIPRDENGEVANTFCLPPDWTIEILSLQCQNRRILPLAGARQTEALPAPTNTPHRQPLLHPTPGGSTIAGY